MSVVTILLLADIHSNVVALNAVLQATYQKYGEPDYIITLGDYVGYNCYPNEVLDWVKINADVMVLGNHDLAVALGNADGFNRDAKKAALWNTEKLTLENRTFLSFLEQQTHFFIFDSWSIFCLHGHPADPVNGYLRPDTPKEKYEEYLQMIPKSRFMFHGHTHLPNFYKDEVTGTIVVNPGSVGQPRDRDPRASACVLRVSEDPNFLEHEFLRVEYDITLVARDMREFGLPHRLSERLFFGE